MSHNESIGSKRSNESLLERLSCNVFITNFPSDVTVRELWNACDQYGKVLDVYTPKKLSKQGKAFAFVRFKKVNDVDSLIRNLRSIWMGSFRLFSNVARFNRDTVHKPSITNVKNNVPGNMNSYAAVAKGNDTQESDMEPLMVLEKGLLNYEGDPVLVGCVKEFKSLPNLYNVCCTEGFPSVRINYLGGFWVLMEFDSIQPCEKFHTHNEIKSWFSGIEKWSPQFEVKDRVVWVDVEGVPLKAWTSATFHKTANKWGDLVYMEDSNASNKYSMRLCIKTTIQLLIAKSFKVILEGKIAVVRAKEVTGWVPKFGLDDNLQQQDDKNVKSDKNSFDGESSHADDDGEEMPEFIQNNTIDIYSKKGV
ncbi:RNA-directed DNA polymerase, eukaryota [Tanacetum coccineum]|uniref:RNA-directed DNA polymerase, eukaryota n=1 Tax=Tanacetum coccineum TaxID=301880 RepID=A0ABQ5FNX9_9ASTR